MGDPLDDHAQDVLFRDARSFGASEFFPEGHVRSNFLCNVGYGDRSKLFPRAPRLAFEEACSLL